MSASMWWPSPTPIRMPWESAATLPSPRGPTTERVFAHLAEMPANTELSTIEIAEALDITRDAADSALRKVLLREGKVTSRRKPTGKGGIATYWTVQHNQGEANEHN